MKACWIIGIAMAAGLRTQSEKCTLDVFLDSGVPMPTGILLNANAKATQVFREIGVNLLWLDRMPAGEPWHAHSTLA